jgi:hypothetical protein
MQPPETRCGSGQGIVANTADSPRGLPFTFHVKHVRARQHRGTDDLSNLALACPFCNRFKGPNLTAVDTPTGEVVPLFNPRMHPRDEHFAVEGPLILGRTPIGRATVDLLNMNGPAQLEVRAELLAADEW